MKNFLLILGLAFATNANAAVRPFYQDVKLPTQQMVERQLISDPAAAGTTNVLSAHAANTSTAAVVVTSFVAQPDVPRNLVITPHANTPDIGTCSIHVIGTNYLNRAMAEDFNFAANATGAVTGAQAFKTITSITFPANCEDAPFQAAFSVGYGEKLGIKRCMRNAGNVLGSTVAGVWETTRPTVTAGASVELNTADFNGTMNGSSDFELFFFQNYTCL